MSRTCICVFVFEFVFVFVFVRVDSELNGSECTTMSSLLISITTRL